MISLLAAAEYNQVSLDLPGCGILGRKAQASQEQPWAMAAGLSARGL